MKSILILFLLKIIIVRAKIATEKDNEKLLIYFANFLSKFSDFLIEFHIDDSSKHLANQIIASTTTHIGGKYPQFVIYNHDHLLKKFLRPSVANVLNIIFLKKRIATWEEMASHLNIGGRDVIAFIGQKKDLEDQIEASETIKLAGNILLIDILGENITIYKMCFYCGNFSRKFVELESSGGPKRAEWRDLRPSSFQNLNQHLLHVVYVQYFPFVYCKTNSTTTFLVGERKIVICLEMRGIESDFLRTMAVKLNFSYVVHVLDSNYSFFNMIEYVNQKRADIAFGGISITADRIPLVQFSKQYNFENYHFMYLLKLTFEDIFDKFWDPFRAYLVWSLYFGSFVLLSITLFVALKIRKTTSYKKATLRYVFWSLGYFFVEQSHPDIDGLFRSRLNTGMLLGLWWWVCLILCNFYKSSILSTMVQPPNDEPDGIEGLVLAGFRFTGSIQYADIIRDLLHVPDPLYAEALRKTFYGEDACKALENILPGHVAMLDEYSELQFELKTICHLDDSIWEKFRIAKQPVRSSGHGWATQLGAPYTQALNKYMSLVLSAGLFKKWTQDVTNKLAASLIPKSREIKSNEVNPLSLQRAAPIFIIYSCGILLSIVCFGVQILVNVIKIWKRKLNEMKRFNRF